ncbi:hypothetical protein SCHPADRAFT_948298 [Schizopora paradoxa]|uniref:Secreted protein n=1 Tax=Schizopora paradoxa TaxID=27342 RepID=A0A0H2QXW7_9AGAM|nr:hypothetical protein SCHPADRAFT_948298 [Schizopora paradoxa]
MDPCRRHGIKFDPVARFLFLVNIVVLARSADVPSPFQCGPVAVEFMPISHRARARAMPTPALNPAQVPNVETVSLPVLLSLAGRLYICVQLCNLQLMLRIFEKLR